MAERALAFVLHDVAPETWPDYEPLVGRLDAQRPVPITWLVVPDFHHRNPLARDPTFCRFLESRLQRGDELVLHGYSHTDSGPTPLTPRDWFMRRIFTHEGEFYALDEGEALARIEAGIALFRRLGWPLHGFVAPAWLMSAGTRAALSRTGLRYTSDPGHLFRLPDFEPIDAPGLVWSSRSAWRRELSRQYCERLLARHRQAPLLRLGLHPVDMRHERSREWWFDALGRLLADGRLALTKHDWLQRQGGA